MTRDRQTTVVGNTVVQTAMGELRAVIRRPVSDGVLPGLVFVDGSGCGGIEDWGDWPAWISGCVADDSVPVAPSVARIAAALPAQQPGHGIAVFPGANHSLFTGDPDPAIARRDQLAPGFLPMLTAFLAA